jgi:hypothetical protein
MGLIKAIFKYFLSKSAKKRPLRPPVSKREHNVSETMIGEKRANMLTGDINIYIGNGVWAKCDPRNTKENYKINGFDHVVDAQALHDTMHGMWGPDTENFWR